MRILLSKLVECSQFFIKMSERQCLAGNNKIRLFCFQETAMLNLFTNQEKSAELGECAVDLLSCGGGQALNLLALESQVAF